MSKQYWSLYGLLLFPDSAWYYHPRKEAFMEAHLQEKESKLNIQSTFLTATLQREGTWKVIQSPHTHTLSLLISDTAFSTGARYL